MIAAEGLPLILQAIGAGGVLLFLAGVPAWFALCWIARRSRP